MEFANDNSVPCLLELMDNNVIKCDIAFGSTLHFDEGLEPELGVFTKGSPSHESDSGCSDMSEDIGSVSCETPLLNLDLFECDSTEVTDEDLDKELEMYFAKPLTRSQDKQDNSSLHTPVSVELDVAQNSEPEEMGEDSSDEDYLPPKVMKSKAMVVHTKGKVPAVQKREYLHPIVSTSQDNIARKPAVKVVKVVKTPAVSKHEIDNSIMQALDERNKKNAIQAKLNREKKKAYIKNLEDEIDSLKDENTALKESNRKTKQEKKALEMEVEYLRSVLANDSALSGLLKNINHPKDVKLSSTYSRKRSADLDHDYQVSKKVKVGSGVCLHVDQGNVSLEFCSKCSNMACSTSEES